MQACLQEKLFSFYVIRRMPDSEKEPKAESSWRGECVERRMPDSEKEPKAESSWRGGEWEVEAECQ